MGRGMTSLHALPGYANTPLAEWQEYPYQALQGGGGTREFALSTNKAIPLHPSIFLFFDKRAATQETTRAACNPRTRDKQKR